MVIKKSIMFNLKVIIILYALYLLIQKLVKKMKYENFTNIENRIGYPIYWINMDKSTDRKKFMTNQFKKYKLENYRFPAVDGNNIDSRKFKINKDMKTTYKPGEIGATLSHISLIVQLYNKNIDSAIVFEDDISVATQDKWDMDIPTLVNKAPNDWEIIQLSTSAPLRLKKYLKGDELFVPWCVRFHFAIYLINRKGMTKIYNRLYKNNKIDISNEDISGRQLIADHYIFKICKTYTYTKPLFIHMDFPSTIRKIQYKFIKDYNKYTLDYFI